MGQQAKGGHKYLNNGDSRVQVECTLRLILLVVLMILEHICLVVLAESTMFQVKETSFQSLFKYKNTDILKCSNDKAASRPQKMLHTCMKKGNWTINWELGSLSSSHL